MTNDALDRVADLPVELLRCEFLWSQYKIRAFTRRMREQGRMIRVPLEPEPRPSAIANGGKGNGPGSKSKSSSARPDSPDSQTSRESTRVATVIRPAPIPSCFISKNTEETCEIQPIPPRKNASNRISASLAKGRESPTKKSVPNSGLSRDWVADSVAYSSGNASPTGSKILSPSSRLRGSLILAQEGLDPRKPRLFHNHFENNEVLCTKVGLLETLTKALGRKGALEIVPLCLAVRTHRDLAEFKRIFDMSIDWRGYEFYGREKPNTPAPEPVAIRPKTPLSPPNISVKSRKISDGDTSSDETEIQKSKESKETQVTEKSKKEGAPPGGDASSSSAVSEAGDPKKSATILVCGRDADDRRDSSASGTSTASKSGSKNVWLLKPGLYANRGFGIKISEEWSYMEKHLHKQIERNKVYLVQKYIEKPFTVDGRKFDIRGYALLVDEVEVEAFGAGVDAAGKEASSTKRTPDDDPTLSEEVPPIPAGPHKFFGWMYKDWYVRTSSCKYSASDFTNRLKHLNNDAVQKHSDQYGKFESANKLSIPQFQQ